jgi:hypothetical protein
LFERLCVPQTLERIIIRWCASTIAIPRLNSVIISSVTLGCGWLPLGRAARRTAGRFHRLVVQAKPKQGPGDETTAGKLGLQQGMRLGLSLSADHRLAVVVGLLSHGLDAIEGLPADIFERLEAKAKAEGRPFNRVAINDLASIPGLEKQRRHEDLFEQMQIVLAKYGARITVADLGDALLRAVDDVLDAKTDGELRARIDRLRVLRADMLKRRQ